MSAIWDLSQRLSTVDELIDNAASLNEGEIPEELLTFFDLVSDEFRANADGYADLIRKKKAEAEMLANQAKRFSRESAKLTEFVKRLQSCVLDAMEAIGERKLGSFSVCRNGGKTPLEIEGEVPEQFIRYEPRTDTDAIRSELESGGELSFARLGERGKHVRVKGS